MITKSNTPFDFHFLNAVVFLCCVFHSIYYFSPRTSPDAKKIAGALRIQFNRQSWALEPGQVAAALFSEMLDDETKTRMAAKILALRPTSDSDEAVIQSTFNKR